jgi:hypothetical protein
MKYVLLALFLVPVAAAGCVGPFGPTDAAPKHTAAAAPTVHADQVNDGNAHAMALALKAEMDADADVQSQVKTSH